MELLRSRTESPIDPARARALFAETRGVVGRVRQDASLPDGRGIAFWVVADNLRKGAATNAVELAELVLSRGLLGRR